MPKLEFPIGLQGVDALPKTKRVVENMFNNGQARMIGRPGITLNKLFTGKVARGSFEWNGFLYIVFSQDLEKITNVDTGASTTIGTIEGPTAIRVAKGQTKITIIAKSGKSYTLDKSDTLVDTSANANFEAFVDTTYIDGRTIYIPADGSPAKFSDVEAPQTIQTSSFFDAQELPDRNNGVFNFQNTLYITGENSVELFRNTGAVPNPFQRIDRSRLDVGAVGGILEYNKRFLFVGRDKEQSFGIFSLEPGRALKISNEAVDLVIAQNSFSALQNTVAGRINFHGYDIATFTFPNDSFGFYAGNWFRLSTLFNNASSPWGAGFITQFEGRYYTAFEGRFGVFGEVNSDYGEPITRRLTFAIQDDDNKRFTVQSIDYDVSQGFNKRLNVQITSVTNSTTTPGVARFNFSAAQNITLAVGQQVTIEGFVTQTTYNVTGLITATNTTTYFEISSVSFVANEPNVGRFTSDALSIGTIALSTSRNNIDFNDPSFMDLGALGQYSQILRWSPPGGLGGFHGFAAFELFTTENVNVSADGLSFRGK